MFHGRAHRSARAALLIGCLTGTIVLGGCGGGRGPHLPPPDAQRAVAARFARAVLHGDAAGARPLLLDATEPAMTFLLRRAAVHWRGRRVTIGARPRHAGDRWLFPFTGMRSFRDGRFEREDGGLVIVLAPSPAGARVRFFTFVDVRTRYSTHHDGQLLPSKR